MTDSELKIVSLVGPRAHKRCAEYALVLESVGIWCHVQPGDTGSHLLVRAEDLDRAREQLRLYSQENPVRNRRFKSRFGVHEGLTCACLYGLTILLISILEQRQVFALDWWQAGMSHAGLIREGEWWRAMTALGLHADSVHLISNLAFGLVFGFLAGELLGWGLAWSGMLLAGMLGNTLNAFVQAPNHMSIGASTAVFATLGILAAYTWKRRQTQINRWVPLGAGVALLFFLGLRGEKTDIFAHIAGFMSGCFFGLVFGLLEGRALLAAWHRHSLGVVTSLFFVFAWTLAFLSR